MIKTSTMTVTPDLAQQLLDTTKMNRPISRTVVNQYADTMKNGKWQLNGVPIVFDKSGALIDGQHRLKAVVVSGVSVEMAICRGVDAGAFATFDCGRRRNVGQFLAMQGVLNYVLVSNIVSMYNMYQQTGRLYKNASLKDQKLTNEALFEIYTEDAEAYQKAGSYAARRFIWAKVIRRGWIGTMYYILRRKGCSEDKIDFFFRQLFSYAQSNVKPIELLRTRILNMMTATGNMKIESEALCALLFKAWNSYDSWKVVKQLSYDGTRETFPELKFSGSNIIEAPGESE